MTCLVTVATCSYDAQVQTVGIKALKNKLSRYVKLAVAGETVLVTDREEIVAELGPPKPGRRREYLAKKTLSRAEKKGLVVRAKRRGPPRLKPKPIATLAEILRELRDDRDAR